ncbi:MAG: phosphatase PAP2 family protein [Chloroflexi bacterium]|jgi:membrane-associated phospholipid phosphatase|nr:phosphatase PAP2 family protein [Chloroflexota bacterium]
MKPFLREWSLAALARWLVGLVVILGAATIFLGVAGDVWLQEGFAWDEPILRAVYTWRRAWLNAIMLFLTASGGRLAIIPVAALSYVVWRQGRWPDSVTVLASVGGAAVLTLALKALFGRPRPDIIPPLVIETTSSFPSGHTIMAVALYGLMAVFFWRQGHYGWAILSSAWALAVGFSRVYLGVHYPSDVLGSLALGVIWLAVILAVHDRLHQPHRR